MLERGAVVLSLSGHDKGQLLAVVGSEQNRVLVCDGKERPLERPKQKNQRHLAVTDFVLKEEDFRGNRALHKALNQLKCSENGNT